MFALTTDYCASSLYSKGELDLMFDGDSSRLAFVGHTHRPVIRETARRRLVNAGSVGLPLDGDARASYVLAEPPDHVDDPWTVEVRRVPYDLDAAIAAYDNGLRDVDDGYVEIMARQLRSARDYFGPWLRLSRSVPVAELPAALRSYLAARPL